MREIRFQEEQQYDQRDIWLIAIVLGALCLLPILGVISGSTIGVQEILLWMGMVVIVSGVIWYVTHLRLKLVVNDKNLKLRTSPLSVEKEKIKWKEVDSIECHELPKYYSWRGWNVHFSSGNKWHNISGRGVLRIKKKDGDEVVVGCRKYNKIVNVLNDMHRTKNLVRH